MYSTWVVLFVVAAYASAEPCCMPDQWEAYTGMNIPFHDSAADEAYFKRIVFRFAIDATQKKAAATYLDPKEGFEPKGHVIQDFENSKQYIIKEELQYCYVVDTLEDWQDMCIPDEKKFASMVMGSEKKNLPLDTYSYGTEGLNEYMSFEPQSCVPVGGAAIFDSETIHGLAQIGYMNVSLEITNAAAFQIPDYCTTSPSTTEPTMEHWSDLQYLFPLRNMRKYLFVAKP